MNANDEINLLDYLGVIKRHKKLIGTIMGAATVITVIVSLILPKYYIAKAVIMPIGGGGSGVAALLASQLGGLGGLIGISGAGGATPAQRFMALLKTRTLAEEIINKYDLMEVMFGNSKATPSPQSSSTGGEGVKVGLTMEDAVGALLGSYVTFENNEINGTITISAELEDPKLAADIANGYLEGLQNLISSNSLTMSKRNRIFVEKQLAQNKIDLLEAGKDLNEFYKAGRISSVDSKIDVPISTNVNLKSEILNLKQTLNLKNQIQNEEIASVDSLLAQADELQKQKEELESKLFVKDVPQQVYLQYMTLRRNLLTQMNTLLTQQYEMAKIDESKEDLAFQVIDPARVPEQRSKPKRRQMVMMAFMSSLFIGIFAAFFTEYVKKLKSEQVR